MTDLKLAVGKEIAGRVKSGEVLGVGTGSTVDAALDAIAERVVNEKLDVRVVPSSLQSAWRCESIGLCVMHAEYAGGLSWSFDGADAVDDKLRVIKGKGAAMLREKILAARSRRYVVIVDESKVTNDIAGHSLVPVEFVPEARSYVESSLRDLGAESVELRDATAKHGPVVTEKGNLVFDCRFGIIGGELELQVKGTTGVVESGLFLNQVDEALVASASGIRTITR